MIEIKEISEEKINENYRFRTYLKSHADEKTLDEQFKNYIINISKYLIAEMSKLF